MILRGSQCLGNAELDIASIRCEVQRSSYADSARNDKESQLTSSLLEYSILTLSFIVQFFRSSLTALINFYAPWASSEGP